MRNSRDDAGHFCCGADQVVDKLIDALNQRRPAAGSGAHRNTLFGVAFLTDHPPDTGDVLRNALAFFKQFVESVRNFAGYAVPVHRQAHTEVAPPERVQCSEDLLLVVELWWSQCAGHAMRSTAVCLERNRKAASFMSVKNME
ncbi:hypothetical protein DEDE109153_13750 [Deinococcus deserti]